jgi:cytosine/adenosine deaminase-related metal-dependent hydrolase
MSVHAWPQSIAKASRGLILSGARVAIGPRHAVRATLLVRNGKIESVIPGNEAPANIVQFGRVVKLNDHLILPGLINAHDHLQFGAFPRLGQGPYPSWREWAKDIYQPEQLPLRTLLEIPKAERLWWGIVRNALAGVTTVCHHDAAHSLLSSFELPLTVHPQFGWAHSLDGLDWKESYAQTPPHWPFIVHCAEGLNRRSRQEVAKLDRLGKLNGRMVLVHAVGVSGNDWLTLKAAGVWIVWCPTSNLHILGRTLARDIVMSYPFITLGSDSPISAAGDLLDELQAARALMDIPPDLLYEMVTSRAARVLRLSAHEGTVSSGGVANLLIVRDKGLAPCESLATLERSDLIATMHNGEFSVAAEEFHYQQQEFSQRRLAPTERHGLRWYVATPSSGWKLPAFPAAIESSAASFAELTNQ